MALDIKAIFRDKSPGAVKARRKKLALAFLAVAVTAGSGIFIYNAFNRIENLRTIKVSGNIEGNEVKISFRVAGLIQELLVDEGYVIREGDCLARLDKDPLKRARDEARASLKLAVAQYEFDQLEYVRAENLFKEGAVSAQYRDAAKTKADTDRSNVDKLTASLAIADLNLDWGDLSSPLNGYVTVKSSLQGENVLVAGPVFTAIDLNDIWVSAYIDEKDLGRVKFNQKAYVKIDAYPHKKYNGRISFISQQTEFTPKYIQTTRERVKYVYRIKVQVDNSSLDLKPGMPADAYIDVE
ncbi:MAG: efflux RND transporter periplasmic adaptor subunit [Candidatus Omnitrophica bacterium]|nr:efflux RND transporter periplasmic adaptor subunit [Candidatus Omnitrophota bacterium]